MGGGQRRGLMLSVRLCLSSALGVLHRSFHGKCTGTDYHRLERERASERKGGWPGLGLYSEDEQQSEQPPNP